MGPASTIGVNANALSAKTDRDGRTRIPPTAWRGSGRCRSRGEAVKVSSSNNTTNCNHMAPTRTQPDRQAPPSDTGHLPLPHERDETSGAGNTTGQTPRKVIDQARKDIEAGQVDTDMRATPGLDAERRDTLVPTPTGAPKP